MARIRGVDRHRVTRLEAWEVCSTEPDGAIEPRQLDALGPRWIPACVPGTVAGALRAAGQWDLGAERSFDAQEWWYRCRFESAPPRPGEAAVLKLGGLATIADVWVNGVHVLRSDNMFHAHAVDVTGLLRGPNELAIRFSSLGAALKAKRPRPRWRTALVQEQKLRWFRTTLLGRMPGWSPPVEAVGPWRSVALEEHLGLSIDQSFVQTRVHGSDGEVDVSLRVRLLDSHAPSGATVRVGESQAALTCAEVDARVFSLQGRLRLPGVAVWWPRTHGPQPSTRRASSSASGTATSSSIADSSAFEPSRWTWSPAVSRCGSTRSPFSAVERAGRDWTSSTSRRPQPPWPMPSTPRATPG